MVSIPAASLNNKLKGGNKFPKDPSYCYPALSFFIFLSKYWGFVVELSVKLSEVFG
jgi:hypothetical protein